MRDAPETYFARLDVDAATLDRLAGHLAPDELDRAGRFRFERDRRRFVARRGLLREWLAKRLDAPPRSLAFETGEWGKPRLNGHDLKFSASHRGEWMMAVAATTEVGCDIEALDPDLDWRPLARLLPEDPHSRALAHLDEPRARHQFFRCWTRMEASVKATGRGLAPGTDPESVLAGAGHHQPQPGQRMDDIRAPTGYIAAVAMLRGP